MALVLVKDMYGVPLPSLNTSKAVNDTIAAAVAAKPGRINPWYYVVLTISGVQRPAYAKVVNGISTEIQYLN